MGFRKCNSIDKISKSQAQVMHCIKQCQVNQKIKYNPNNNSNPRLYTSIISTKDLEGSQWLISLELAIISKVAWIMIG